MATLEELRAELARLDALEEAPTDSPAAQIPTPEIAPPTLDELKAELARMDAEAAAMVPVAMQRERERVQTQVFSPIKSVDDRMRKEALERLDAAQPAVVPTEEGGLIDPTRNALGIPEAALTLGTGAIGFATSVVALPALLLVEGVSALGKDEFDINDIADQITGVQQLNTITPFSEQGKVAVESIAAPIMALDDKAYQLSGWLGQDNPIASSLIYGLLNAGTTIAGSKGGAALKLGKRGKDIQRLAEELGIDLRTNDLPGEVVKAAKNMSAAERGQHAPVLRQALQDSKALKETIAQRNAVNSGLDEAIQASTPAELEAAIRTRLVDSGVDVGSMPRVEATLSRIRNGMEGEQAIVSEAAAARMARITRRRNKEFDPRDEIAAQEAVIVNRVARMERQARSDAAATAMSAPRGTPPTAQQAAKLKKQFHPDQYVKKMLNEEATPEMINNWTFGAGKNGFSDQAGAVLRRIKELVGEDSPAWRGVQQDFLFRVARPLLGAEPDFKAFVKLYDDLIIDNPTIIKEMGLEMSDMKPLRQFAQAAIKDAERGKIVVFKDGILSVSRFVAGNALARNAVKVNTVSNVLKLLAGESPNKQKRLLAELSGAIYDAPLTSKGTAVAASATQATVLADLEAIMKEMTDEERSQFQWLKDAIRDVTTNVE
jgi:hypothetical protein